MMVRFWITNQTTNMCVYTRARVCAWVNTCFLLLAPFSKFLSRRHILANTLVMFMLLDVFVHPSIGCLCVVVVDTGGDDGAAIMIRRQASLCLFHTAAISSGCMLMYRSYACVKSIGLNSCAASWPTTRRATAGFHQQTTAPAMSPSISVGVRFH